MLLGLRGANIGTSLRTYANFGAAYGAKQAKHAESSLFSARRIGASGFGFPFIFLTLNQ
jgi:hypothetical protein